MKYRITVLFTIVLILQIQAQNFNQILKGVSTNRELLSEFGNDVSISGNYAVIGAIKENLDESGVNSKLDAGAAYIYERDGSGNWSVTQKIVASDRAAYDNFGSSVSISGNYLVIGAYLEDHDTSGLNQLTSAGAAYVFARDSLGVWSEVQKLVASDRDAGDYFGYSVSISGNDIVVGAYFEEEDTADSNSFYAAGSSYIFEIDSSGLWLETQKLVASDRSSSDRFGKSVSIDNDYIIVGASFQDTDVSGGGLIGFAGSAYLFEKDSLGAWVEVQKIVAPDREYGDYFGNSVSISGNYSVVGAYLEDHSDTVGGNTLSSAGSAYVFYRDSTGLWSFVQKIVAGDRGAGDHFGTSVSISGEYICAGASLEDQNPSGLDTLSNAGAAYIFKIDAAGNWNQTQKIVSSDRNIEDRFGTCVAVSGEYVLVGAPKEDEDASGLNTIADAGSAYFYSPPRAIVKLIDSDGFPVNGGEVAVRQSGVYVPYGTTNSFGEVEALLEFTGSTKFRMTLDGGAVYKFKNIQVSGLNVVLFQTKAVTAELNTSTGGNLAASFEFKAGGPGASLGWQTFGSGVNDTLTGMEMVGTNYKFRVRYKGGSYQFAQNVGNDTALIESTIQATMTVEGSTGTPLVGGIAKFNNKDTGYELFGSGTLPSSMELLPAKYLFKLRYNGIVNYKVQNLDTNATVLIVIGTPNKTNNSSLKEADAKVTLGVYPNPFTEFTNFTFELKEPTEVSLIIYDLSGKMIRRVAKREFESGTNQVRWDGNNNLGNSVANGVYFYRLEAGEFVKTDRIIVTR